MDKHELCGMEMTVDQAEQWLAWFEKPEALYLFKFAQLQLIMFDRRLEREIGENAIADVLTRERNIAGRMAMRSLLAMPEDIRLFIEDAKKLK